MGTYGERMKAEGVRVATATRRGEMKGVRITYSGFWL